MAPAGGFMPLWALALVFKWWSGVDLDLLYSEAFDVWPTYLVQGVDNMINFFANFCKYLTGK